ncbi:MAG: ABC transporter substrate-binding protein [Calditrichota bacterium]
MKYITFVCLYTFLLTFAFAQSDASLESMDQDSRIISVGGHITETVFALGAGANVVGTDLSSIYPAEVRELPQVGYHRTISAEGVLSLNPSFFIGSSVTGPPEAVEQLRRTKIDMLIVEDDYSIDGARNKIRLLADKLNRKAEGDSLVAILDEDLKKVEMLKKKVKKKPRVLFLLSHSPTSLLVAGRGTRAAKMIELAEGESVGNDFNGFKPLNPESLVAKAPDVIIMLSMGINSVGGIESLLERPGINLTPAAKNKRVEVFDDQYFTSFGPRLGKALYDVMLALHPYLKDAE